MQPKLDLDTLPTDKAEILKLQPVFPRLAPDAPTGCPCPMLDIKRYVAAETGRRGHDLSFGRTAVLGDVHFWLWGFLDAGETCYVDVSVRGGESLVSMGAARN